MEHNSMKIAAMVGLSALCGCAVLGSEARRAPVERLDERGASAAVLSVEGGTALDFVNADARPHQIYSNDCRELSSPLLNPGETYTARLGTAPKLCHFQDLLAPLSSSYSGTVQVHAVIFSAGQRPRDLRNPCPDRRRCRRRGVTALRDARIGRRRHGRMRVLRVDDEVQLA